MEYLLLIIEPPGQRQSRTEAEGRELFARMVAFGESLKARGILRGVQSLKADTESVRVRLRNGKRTLVDGPFAEAKEMVGGYFIVEAASRADAIAIACEVPAAEWATVEVREFGPCFA